jgi:hypothetical protein
MEEWIASDMILTEPIAVPTINFIRTSPVFERTDKRAVLSFSLSSDALSICGVLINAGVLFGMHLHQGIVQKSLLKPETMHITTCTHDGNGHNKKENLFSCADFNKDNVVFQQRA